MKLQHIQSIQSIKHQQGAVLAISLILLLVLTVIGTTSMQTTTLQERMAGNASDRNSAFQDAETAIRDGEKLVQTTTNLGPFLNASTATGLYLPASVGNEWWLTSSNIWGSGAVAGSAATSEYIIEKLPANTGKTGSLEAGTPESSSGYFRITARSIGQSGDTRVMLQTIYKQQ